MKLHKKTQRNLKKYRLIKYLHKICFLSKTFWKCLKKKTMRKMSPNLSWKKLENKGDWMYLWKLLKQNKTGKK